MEILDNRDYAKQAMLGFLGLLMAHSAAAGERELLSLSLTALFHNG